MRDVSAILSAHHADRRGHTPTIFVHGPGCLPGGRSFVESCRYFAVQLCDRLNDEHGPGTHRIIEGDQ